MRDKIVYIVISLLVIATIYSGYRVFTLSNKLEDNYNATMSAIAKQELTVNNIVDFLNKVTQQQ